MAIEIVLYFTHWRTLNMPKGRKKSIDGEQVEKLASFGCTNKEIASFFNVNEIMPPKCDICFFAIS